MVQRTTLSKAPSLPLRIPSSQGQQSSQKRKRKNGYVGKGLLLIDFPRQSLLPLSNLICDNGFPGLRDQIISHILQNTSQPLLMLKHHIWTV